MKKKVLLFACIEKNIGDDLFIYTLCERYKDVNFYISSSAEYGALKKIDNLHFSKSIKLWNKFNTLDSSSKIKNFIAHCIQRVLSWLYIRYDSAVYIVGNAFKNYNYQGKNDSRWIVERVKLVNNFYLLSTNFGPYYAEEWKNDFETIFSEMKDVCFRDYESYKLFNKIENIRYAPDAILSLGRRKKSSYQENVILISLIDCAFYTREDKVRKCVMAYESKLIELINYFTKKEYKITLISSNTEQDMPAVNRIYCKCNKKQNINIFEYTGDYHQIFKLYEQACFVVGTRLHTIILAWLYNLPVFPIIYDIKVKNMLESYGFYGGRVELEQIDKLMPQDVERTIQTYEFTSVDSLIQDAQCQFKVLDKELIGDELL